MPKKWLFWDNIADRWDTQLNVVSKITAAAKKSKKYRRQKSKEWKILARIADEMVEEVARVVHSSGLKKIDQMLKDNTPIFEHKTDLLFPIGVEGPRPEGGTRMIAFGGDQTLNMLKLSTDRLPKIILTSVTGNTSDMTRWQATQQYRFSGYRPVTKICPSYYKHADVWMERFFLVIAYSEPFRTLPPDIKKLIYDFVFTYPWNW